MHSLTGGKFKCIGVVALLGILKHENVLVASLFG